MTAGPIKQEPKLTRHVSAVPLTEVFVPCLPGAELEHSGSFRQEMELLLTIQRQMEASLQSWL